MTAKHRIVLVFVLLVLVLVVAGCTPKRAGLVSVKNPDNSWGFLQSNFILVEPTPVPPTPPAPPLPLCQEAKLQTIEVEKIDTVLTITTTPITTTEAITTTATLTGITKGDTVDIGPGIAVLGDIIFSNSETQKLVDAYDNGGSGEGTVFWNNSSETISLHAPWGAGRKIITSEEAAMSEVYNELRAGCGDKDGCKTVRFVMATSRGIRVEYYSDDDVK
jgi:hypothetical protein